MLYYNKTDITLILKCSYFAYFAGFIIQCNCMHDSTFPYDTKHKYIYLPKYAFTYTENKAQTQTSLIIIIESRLIRNWKVPVFDDKQNSITNSRMFIIHITLRLLMLRCTHALHKFTTINTIKLPASCILYISILKYDCLYFLWKILKTCLHNIKQIMISETKNQ